MVQNGKKSAENLALGVRGPNGSIFSTFFRMCVEWSTLSRNVTFKCHKFVTPPSPHTQKLG